MNLSYPTIPTTIIAQAFGNHNPMMYPGSGRHMGIDLAGAVGTAIYAACPGVVDVVNGTGAHGYGRHVILAHGDFKTLYAHLSKLHVAAGQTVEAGAMIGEMGGDPTDKDPIDGASSGPHLHFEVILPNQPEGDTVKTIFGWTVDPFAYLLKRFGGEVKYKGTITDRSGSRVRSAPNTKDGKNILYALKQHHTFDVVEVKPNDEGDVWAQVRALRPEFVAVTYQGRKFVELTATPLSSSTTTSPHLPSADTQENGGTVVLVDEKSVRLDEVRRIVKYLEAREKELE